MLTAWFAYTLLPQTTLSRPLRTVMPERILQQISAWQAPDIDLNMHDYPFRILSTLRNDFQPGVSTSEGSTTASASLFLPDLTRA